MTSATSKSTVVTVVVPVASVLLSVSVAVSGAAWRVGALNERVKIIENRLNDLDVETISQVSKNVLNAFPPGTVLVSHLVFRL